MAYQPIENYGMIGDLRTAALVGLNGSIDWLCIPHFDSPSVFAALLDDKKGGRFRIAPINGDSACKQFYWPDTNVLVTRFLASKGAIEVTDFMPIREVSEPHSHQLIRRVTAVRGRSELRLVCQPAFNFARDEHTTVLNDNGAEFHSKDLSLSLATRIPLQRIEQGVAAKFTLSQGETAVFVLHQITAQSDHPVCPSAAETEAIFRQTIGYWVRWVGKCTYHGRWREIIYRSALALKLMTFEPTGAIVAAPTCSLPESMKGKRNWDYRYSWIRDSAFTVYALLRIGFTEEADRYMQFIESLCPVEPMDNPLQIMYGIDGRREITEEVLDHLEGYRGSRPVRVGNAAYKQLQLDIYGELMDAVYRHDNFGSPISYNFWTRLRHLADWVCDHWQQPDAGIWEVRGDPKHFVYSKFMCWVALDRALRLSNQRSFPSDLDRWLKVRNQIYLEIMEKGWNSERQAFTQYYDSATLDAANLAMPLVLFVSPIDPRMLKTLNATFQPLEEGGLVSNSLVFRYNPMETDDGLSGDEGTFNICTFWLVEALARAGRYHPARLEEARLIFERMLGYANHLGLYAEETGHSGEALGNFPQAFTHLALIRAAYNLDQALGPQNGAKRY